MNESMKNIIRIPEMPFAPNVLNWIGGSIVGSMNESLSNFRIKRQEYFENDKKIPDRIGKLFLFGDVGDDSKESSTHFNDKAR